MLLVHLSNINKIYQTSHDLKFQALKNISLSIDSVSLWRLWDHQVPENLP